MAGDGRKISVTTKRPERVCHRCRNPRFYRDFSKESPYVCSECLGVANGKLEDLAMVARKDSLSLVMDSVRGMMKSENPDGPEFTKAFIDELGGPAQMGKMAANDFKRVRGNLKPDGSPLSEEEYLRLGGFNKEAKTIRQWWEMTIRMQQENDTFKRDSTWLNDIDIDELEQIVGQVVHKGLSVEYIVGRMEGDAALRTGLMRAIHGRPDWLHELATLPPETATGDVIDAEAELVETGDLGDSSLPDGGTDAA